MTRKNPTVILHTDDPDPALEFLGCTHPDLPLHGCDSYAGLPELLDKTGAEVIFSVRFAGTPGYPRMPLLESKTLKWLSVGGSGTDHMSPWDPSKLTVTNAAGVAADMMAEYAIGAMLSFSLDFRRFARAQAAREWIAGRVEPIAGKTVLILGLGKTGRAVALRAKAMGMSTIGVRARPHPTDHLDEVHGMNALPDLWPCADFIVCGVPLLENTRRLVDAKAFAAMKREAVLIDVSRGGIVEETALVAALQSGNLRGAALDVFTTEPLPRDHVLWSMPNVIVTPHCSSVYEGWEMKSLAMFCENLHRYRRGEALENVVDPVRGY